MMKKDAETLIDDEFGCWYQNFEIPVDLSPEDAGRIAELATASAERILSSGGTEAAAPVAALLRAMVADQAHPLLEQLSEGTMMGWHYPDEFPLFVAIATAMADKIEALAAGGGTAEDGG